MPYLSHSVVAHTSNAWVCGLSSNAVAIVKRQYNRGNPVLSYSLSMVYSSRCFKFVLSVMSCHYTCIGLIFCALTGCVNFNFDNLSSQQANNVFHHPHYLDSACYCWKSEDVNVVFKFAEKCMDQGELIKMPLP